MLLFSTHMMLATATGIEAMALDEKECNRLAVALKAVGDHYHFEASQETLLWMNLIGAAAAVYGPRGVMLYKHVRAGKTRVTAPVVPRPAPVHTAEQAATKAAQSPAPELKPNEINLDVLAHASLAG